MLYNEYVESKSLEEALMYLFNTDDNTNLYSTLTDFLKSSKVGEWLFREFVIGYILHNYTPTEMVEILNRNNCASDVVLAVKNAMHDKLYELVRDGLKHNIVNVVTKFDCSCCQIGDIWFYAFGSEYEDLSVEEIYKTFTLNEIADFIVSTIEDFETNDPDEYRYYVMYLIEHQDSLF